ncbi:MAG: precorrin-3B C(17)-methyltransferase [Deltaproteobacteria bacterium]
MAEPVIVVLNATGEALAQKLKATFGWAVHGRTDRVAIADLNFENALDHIRVLFAAGQPIIGICASGILIRAVAPLLSDKRSDPPVLSLTDDGATIIPLLGGHHGANRLGREIAHATKGHAAVTTAGDLGLGLALDDPPAGWRLGTPGLVAKAMGDLVNGRGARVNGQAEWLSALPKGDLEIDIAPAPARPDVLTYHPLTMTLGVGCSRNCPPEELRALVDQTLAKANIAPAALRGIFTVDLKGDEPAMIALARDLNLPLRLFAASELEAETPRLANPSDVVFAEVGCHGVSEAAALAGAGQSAKLLVEKQKSHNATVAVAIAPEPITILNGQPRGHLSIVGIGPGQAAWRTPEVSRMVAEASDLVGYGLYIDLLGPLAAGKPRHDFPLGGEEARCRHALALAAEGKNVALICSGDAGIYAMATLVYEVLARKDIPAASRVEIVVSPGISALQAAAARAGAPLGHDFCAISLSDLLTPVDDIRKRLKAAAEGDFVVAFYNPVSERRRTLLAEARDILLQHRPAETPVILARSLGRPDETLRHRTLKNLQVDEVDMMTVVLVGSSQSKRIETADGPRVYTPRGYLK